MNRKRKNQNAGLPFVLVNMSMTADGKIAPANRKFSPFGSARDQEHMMELRASADAVIAGARTVDLNPVHLGPGETKYRRMRVRQGLAEYNIRVIVSGSGSIDPNALIFKKRFSPIIILTTGRVERRRLAKLKTLADDVKICGAREINFLQAFRWLRDKWGIKRLLGEGGGELNDALFRAGVINELHLTLCPFIFGGRGAPTISDGTGVLRLADATKLSLKSLKRVGDELFLVYDVASGLRPE